MVAFLFAKCFLTNIKKVDISAKVWRYTGEKWSRQSEELPLHRVLDLAVLICRTSLYFHYDHFFLKCLIPMIDDDIKLFSQALNDNGEMIGERLRVLSRLLKEMGY